MQDWDNYTNNENERDTNQNIYPVSGDRAVQEALEKKAEQELEFQRRQQAMRQARELAEEARRAEEIRRVQLRARWEEQQRREAERKQKAKQKRRTVLAVSGLLFALAALGLGGFSFWRMSLMQNRISALESRLSAQESQPGEMPVRTLPEAVKTQTVSLSSSQLTDVSDMVAEAIRSVVSIEVTGKVKVSTGFFGSREYQTSGAGSGVIIGDNESELWILTNNHVVDDAESLTVVFQDGSKLSAYIKGINEENDLAVLGVSLESISAETMEAVRAAKIGDSSTLKLGEGVVAIGNALGWGQSVTTGVVSGLSRDIKFSDGTQRNLLQISAAINPGNSGGALLNAQGELIGINNAKYSSEEVEGVGFAIPISSILDIIEELSLKEARIPVSQEDFPYLGASFKNYPSGYLSYYGIPQGAYIYEISAGSPAEQAGLLANDIITAINGVTVESYADLMEEMQYYKGGTQVELTVMRLEKGINQEKTISVMLGFQKDKAN